MTMRLPPNYPTIDYHDETNIEDHDDYMIAIRWRATLLGDKRMERYIFKRFGMVYEGDDAPTQIFRKW
jgi:hypothetical protein